jgi:hypothetical protein
MHAHIYKFDDSQIAIAGICNFGKPLTKFWVSIIFMLGVEKCAPIYIKFDDSQIAIAGTCNFGKPLDKVLGFDYIHVRGGEMCAHIYRDCREICYFPVLQIIKTTDLSNYLENQGNSNKGKITEHR